MSKGLEVLESLDKLEECAYAMKDLPMSNWIDLANSEAKLDLKIMNWVETIKFELFKGKQALQRLETIDNANPSEALECLTRLKKEKALEIIKKKLVNVVDLYQCTDLYTYNSLVKGTFFDGVPRELIQEEFDLLKEVFCND